MPLRPLRAAVAALAAALWSVSPAAAQELEPRAYSPSPTGTTFIVSTATRSVGDVFTDAASPLTDVEADIGVLGIGAGHTFALLGRSAMVLGLLPVAWGEASGQVGEGRRHASRRGLADPRLKLSMILAGSRPMSRAEFVKAPRRPIAGVSFTAVPPIGQYDATKLVNLGSHRWSFKPEAGISLPAGRWTVDGYAGIWLFTENDAYYPATSVRAQDPVVALQAHVSYTLYRRAWVAFNGTWYGGGKTTVDERITAEPYRNTRIGATLAIPIGTRQSVKFAYSAGATTRVGADFKTVTAGWQLVLQ